MDNYVFQLNILFCITFWQQRILVFFSSFVTEISEHVKIKSGTTEEDGTEFDAFFPNFIWAIRDFTLELELDGKSITSDDYLEHALTPKIGN